MVSTPLSHSSSQISKIAMQQALRGGFPTTSQAAQQGPLDKSLLQQQKIPHLFSMPLFEGFSTAKATTPTMSGSIFGDMPSPREALKQEHRPSDKGYAAEVRQTHAKDMAHKMPQVPLTQMQQMLKQVQSSVFGIMGSPQEAARMAEVLGEHATFEDILAYVMMKIAKEEEDKLTERIQILENGGHPGIKGWFSHRAADLAGMAGSAVGALAGGYASGPGGAAAGAAAGRDVAKQAVNSFTGYNSEDSRQIQFEKLKHQMNKLSEFMTCISNILANMHSTVKNTVSNMRV